MPSLPYIRPHSAPWCYHCNSCLCPPTIPASPSLQLLCYTIVYSCLSTDAVPTRQRHNVSGSIYYSSLTNMTSSVPIFDHASLRDATLTSPAVHATCRIYASPKVPTELPCGRFQAPCSSGLPVRRSSQTPSSPNPHLGRKHQNNIDNIACEMMLMQIQASRQPAPHRCAIKSPVFSRGQGSGMRHPSPHRFTSTRYPSRPTPFTAQQRVPLCRRNEDSALNSWRTILWLLSRSSCSL
ncbi:hypothetical protein IQ06DRAFT_108654 [Phaeosphaeriaceae sp. SRC1lsM3a]|nr:hypothetical protein IQ06DRAFT_108654 [Stagonospora sp. SRC1lsM3a]